MPPRVLPKISPEMLAEMVGTTRSRVNLFMNKFRKLGFHREVPRRKRVSCMCKSAQRGALLMDAVAVPVADFGPPSGGNHNGALRTHR